MPNGNPPSPHVVLSIGVRQVGRVREGGGDGAVATKHMIHVLCRMRCFKPYSPFGCFVSLSIELVWGSLDLSFRFYSYIYIYIYTIVFLKAVLFVCWEGSKVKDLGICKCKMLRGVGSVVERLTLWRLAVMFCFF